MFLLRCVNLELFLEMVLCARNLQIIVNDIISPGERQFWKKRLRHDSIVSPENRKRQAQENIGSQKSLILGSIVQHPRISKPHFRTFLERELGTFGRGNR